MNQDIDSVNRNLKQQLADFITEARRNEEKQRRFQQQELRLIATRKLSDLIRMLLYDYRSIFKLHSVTLVLLDPDYELRHILEEQREELSKLPELMFVPDSTQLDTFYGISASCLLGVYRADRHRTLFPGHLEPPTSVALLPLIRQGELIGSLNLGSREWDRYLEEASTDFLQRLAGIVAICFENASNYERLKRIGLTDPLTRLNNRRFFEQRLAEEMARAQRHRQPLTCVFFDLDYFKRINDGYGHQSGDSILCDVASLIKSHLRLSDTIARFGGEEFVALLPETGSGWAHSIAERIRISIANTRFSLPTKEVIQVTISIGIATLSHGGAEMDADTLVATADQALYQAKESGRNRVVCLDSPQTA